MADCADDLTMQHHIDHAKDQLWQYYQDNYAAQVPVPISQPHIATTSSDSPQKVNFTAQYKKWPSVMNDELEESYRLPQEDFDTCNPIHWWVGRHSQFPNLSRLARDILTIPGKFMLNFLNLSKFAHGFSVGSAVAVERIFSGGRDTISLCCASLDPETIRTLMLVKQHLCLACTAISDLLGD
jgi:hypothetical protein